VELVDSFLSAVGGRGGVTATPAKDPAVGAAHARPRRLELGVIIQRERLRVEGHVEQLAGQRLRRGAHQLVESATGDVHRRFLQTGPGRSATRYDGP
jgi:hypothetical protein